MTELGFFDVVARSVTQLLKSGEFVFNRRKGIIVGSDQDGDDAVVLAHVSNFSFCFLWISSSSSHFRHFIYACWSLNVVLCL